MSSSFLPHCRPDALLLLAFGRLPGYIAPQKTGCHAGGTPRGALRGGSPPQFVEAPA